ncbi:hypothetical protein [Rhizobium ruizarguesonis]|uniref:hypothetical protein n=1 Tax=Rhizobium ruizarguesonis TaxID=2081791 RepID=UPI00103142C0|nr:hypothetical protein [Rhizobium ruizarguesonis]TBB03882.1 hypothetical protein ELH52_20800 [Rhizobium ruizarguesonis]
MLGEPDFVSLKRVMQRAKAVRQIDGISRLRTALEEDRILAVAGTLRIFQSSHCFEFTEHTARLVHKSQNLKSLEINAFHAQQNDEHTYILPMRHCRHVFIGLSLAETRYETRLIFRKPIAFEIADDRIAYYESIYKSGEFSESRYRRDHVLTRFAASDVRCRASDVEIEFPYTDEFATRKTRGRPQKWPAEKTFEYAASYWMNAGRPSSPASLVSKILDQYHEDFNNAPVKSTVEKHVRDFLKEPQPVPSQAAKLIESTIHCSPPDADDTTILAEVAKKYKKFGFTPSFSTLMGQIADVRLKRPDK